MTPLELATAALDAIAKRKALQAQHGVDLFRSPAQLVLVLKREARGETVRLFGRGGGPRGAVLCSAADGEVTAAFDAAEILNWLTTRGVIAMTVTEQGVEVRQLVDRELPA